MSVVAPFARPINNNIMQRGIEEFLVQVHGIIQLHYISFNLVS
jgi:hypothetical protein